MYVFIYLFIYLFINLFIYLFIFAIDKKIVKDRSFSNPAISETK